MLKKTLCLICIFLITNTYIYSQSSIEFVHKNPKKTLVFVPGDRMAYAKKGFSPIKSGILETITDSTLTVNGKTIRLSDLKFIGHRKKGTNTKIIGMSALSGIALGTFLASNNTSSATSIVSLSLSASLFTIAEIIAFKNRVHRVKKYTYYVTL